MLAAKVLQFNLLLASKAHGSVDLTGMYMVTLTGHLVLSSRPVTSPFQPCRLLWTDGTCDIFGPNHLSDACVTAVARTGAIASVIEQTDLIATTRGSLFDWQLPSAENPAAFSLGIEYREEFADFKPDSVLGPDVAWLQPVSTNQRPL